MIEKVVPSVVGVLIVFTTFGAFKVASMPDEPIVSSPSTVQEEARRSDFHGGMIKAIRSAREKGELTRAKALRLRVALLSPAFRKHAEDLAVIQMAFSGSDVPVDAQGNIDRAQIDWDAIIEFLERLIPILIQLIEIFSGI